MISRTCFSQRVPIQKREYSCHIVKQHVVRSFNFLDSALYLAKMEESAGKVVGKT